MDIQKIKKLINLLSRSDITEIEIHEGDKSLRLRRHREKQKSVATAQRVQPASSPGAVPEYTATESTKDSIKPSGHTVHSPMVGTVYLSPAPGEDVFVKIGTKVAEGDTLCIIEAMKMFNRIEADKAGTITAILIQDGDPVEYDQPIFIIE